MNALFRFLEILVYVRMKKKKHFSCIHKGDEKNLDRYSMS